MTETGARERVRQQRALCKFCDTVDESRTRDFLFTPIHRVEKFTQRTLLPNPLSAHTVSVISWKQYNLVLAKELRR